MRNILLVLGCLIIALAGCQGAERSKSAKVSDYTLPPSSPWLDPTVQLSSAVRLTTRTGIDLRRALLAPAGTANDHLALLQLRDYSKQPEGEPDPQLIFVLDLETEELHKVKDLPGHVLGVFPAVSGEGWLAYCLQAEAGQAWDTGKLTLASVTAEAGVQVWDTQERIWPLGVLHGQGLAAVPFSKVSLNAGMMVPTLSWQEPMLRLDPKAQVVKPQAGPWLLLEEEGLAAGLVLDYDPALPAQAKLQYLATPGANVQQQKTWTFGYFASGGQTGWLPALAAVDAENLVAIVFQPDGTGKGTGGGAGGIFRLLVLNAATGTADVIEDHLPPDLPVVADQGVVFYTRQAWAGEVMRWEVWASSPDGLRKHLLYHTDDALYLAVEDARGGRRLLLNRQYLEVTGGKPELHSELREVSLDPLTDIGSAAEVQPLTSPEAEKPGDAAAASPDSPELFGEPGGQAAPPAQHGDGPPPITIPK